MKGYNGWSYKPYKPFLYETGDIYICRIAPDVNSIHIEWLGDTEKEYEIFLREKEDPSFYCCAKVKGNAYTIERLNEKRDYEFYIAEGKHKSRIRLARTGRIVGTVVNYLHPEDDVYCFSGQYLCSPSMVRYPDGTLLASMDVYGLDSPQNLTLLYRSDDNGKNWYYVSELFPCFWGKMFLHKNELYMLATSTEYGDLLIGKSLDKGKTFSTPTVLLRGSSSNKSAGIHKNPQNLVLHDGRIYASLEWGSWGTNYKHAAMVMSCDEKNDFMNADNWSFTEPVVYNDEWEGVAQGQVFGNLEGTLCVNPSGELMNVMRYQTTKDSVPKYGKVLQYRVNTKEPDAALEYSHSTIFPANRSKFMIKYDAISKKYYTIACRILSEEKIEHRNLLSLFNSDDMENWEVVIDLIDYRDSNPQKVGFQYVDFEFDGEDIIYLCRTAFNGAHSFHDSNYSTFHRINDFRKL